MIPVVSLLASLAVGDLESVDFDTQIMPIVTRAGCNVGACHGAAAGRGEFYLSLYGSRPSDDFDHITRAFGGRRVSPGRSDESLLLLKATEQISHEGGPRLEYGSEDYETIRQWISQGAVRGAEDHLTSFQFRASQARLRIDEPAQFSATAQFASGKSKDVLSWTVIQADDPSAVHVSEDGQVSISRRGRHIVSARYLNQVATVELVVPWAEASGPVPVRMESPGSIDEFIDRRLLELGLEPEPPATDLTLYRRLSLDLTGTLPDFEQAQAFDERDDPGKVNQLIDELSKSGGEDPSLFDYNWAHVLAQQLQLASISGKSELADACFEWLVRSVSDDTGFDQLARSFLESQGQLDSNPPTAFYLAASGPHELAELTSRSFLGVRLQCANCHDHPLDHWTQDDYHGLAAIFARVKVRGRVYDGTGSVVHPGTGDPAVCRLPSGGELATDGIPRTQLSRWLTSPQNPWFSKAIVNRVWSRLMGRGLVEPVDDLRSSNPATHPELLNWLAEEFADDGFNIRRLAKNICKSRAYQRQASDQNVSSQWKPFYVGAIPKRLSPESYTDAVSSTLFGMSPVVITSLDGLRSRTDGSSLAACLTASCEQAVVSTSDLALQLEMLNGSDLNGVISASGSIPLAMVDDRAAPQEIVRTLYGRAFTRLPDSSELSFWERRLKGRSRSEQREAVQDFVWALLTSNEFLTGYRPKLRGVGK